MDYFGKEEKFQGPSETWPLANWTEKQCKVFLLPLKLDASTVCLGNGEITPGG